jgi:hypothetical protein
MSGAEQAADRAAAEPGAFYMGRNDGTGVYEPRHELLHPEMRDAIHGDALTETQYFAFNLPEEHIHGLVYTWWHPNLGVVSGGVLAFRGIKRTLLASELFDWHVYTSDEALTEDFSHYRLANGIDVQTVEAGERYRVRYADDARGNRLDLTLDAVMPPFMFADGRHFEQTMRTSGELTLRGRTYPIDAFGVRDRSWGSVRAETHEPLPPMTWMSGVFGDDLSFCCSAFDHPELEPEWAGELALPPERAFVGGYLRAGGETIPLAGCEKRTTHDPDTLHPVGVEMTLVDANGGRHEVRGTIVAACTLNIWLNVAIPVCLTRWELNGRVGWGDTQDVQWADYVYARSQTPTTETDGETE